MSVLLLPLAAFPMTGVFGLSEQEPPWMPETPGLGIPFSGIGSPEIAFFADGGVSSDDLTENTPA